MERELRFWKTHKQAKPRKTSDRFAGTKQPLSKKTLVLYCVFTHPPCGPPTLTPRPPCWGIQREPFARRAFGKNRYWHQKVKIMKIELSCRRERYFWGSEGSEILQNLASNHQKINKKFKQMFDRYFDRFWIDFGIQNRPKIDQKINQKIDDMLNSIFVDFWSILELSRVPKPAA